ncbi:hypothetical protein QJQ45_010111 [Haematococcus lacustris]|nr:hypothetical protein QJQ45_010111 [Haematococcus lacustris]
MATKERQTVPRPVPEDPDDDILDRDEALQPDLAEAERNRKASGEARAVRDRDNTYHDRKCKLGHLIDLPQELWDAFLDDAVQPRVEAISERGVLASLLLGLLVRGLFTIRVADPLGLHDQPVYTDIPVSQAAIPDLSCRNLFLQLCRGLPGNGANTSPNAAVAAVLAAHPDTGRGFYDRDVSAALNIRRCAVGQGPRPTELCYWDGRPAMPKPGRPGQEWVYLRDKALLLAKDDSAAWSSAYHDVARNLRRTSSTQMRNPPGYEALTPLGGHKAERGKSQRSVSADRQAWASTISAPTPRARDKFVPLPSGAAQLNQFDEHDEDRLSAEGAPDSYMLPAIEGEKLRLRVITSCASYTRDEVIKVITSALPRAQLSKYPEVLHVQTPFSSTQGRSGDAFIFDYGVIILWALDSGQEKVIMQLLLPCQVRTDPHSPTPYGLLETGRSQDLNPGSRTTPCSHCHYPAQVKPLQDKDVQQETMAFQYSRDVAPNIKNDCITISSLESSEHAVKLAISHALAQSSKLNVYEERVWVLVEQMAKLMGEVFIQKSEVNLLSPVLDTPDWFWSRPDNLKMLYDKVCLYVELQDRIALVNSRFKLVQSMLGSWSDHASHHHVTRLDRIIIILIVVQASDSRA